ncbi:MAG: hypothetical protein ACQESV_08040 [Thermodesulfobacteriota bacterium]
MRILKIYVGFSIAGADLRKSLRFLNFYEIDPDPDTDPDLETQIPPLFFLKT